MDLNKVFSHSFSSFSGPSGILLPETSYIVSQDIAKDYDYTTTSVFRITPTLARGRSEGEAYYYMDEIFLDQRQLSYTDLSTYTRELQLALDILGQSVLIVDETGVGNAVFDIYSQAGLDPFGIVFTGGENANTRRRKELTSSKFGFLSGCNVPKKDLVSSLQVLMEQGRIRRAPGLKYQDEVEIQYRNFIGRINENHYVKYGNSEDTIHDDIIVAHAMAAWYFLHMKGLGSPKLPKAKMRSSYRTDPFESWDR